MDTIKRVYAAICRAEELIAAVLLFIIMAVVFISAVARTFGRPINWAVDLSLLLFPWLIFLGASAALRHQDLVSINMILGRLPGKVQDFIYLFFLTLIIIFLASLVRYGIPLALENWERPFVTLGISFSWATLSVAYGAISLIITLIVKAYDRFQLPPEERYLLTDTMH